MRFLVIAITAALLMLPTAVPARASGTAVHAAKAATIDLSATKHKKKMAKTAARRKKEKVEYMRAAPM